MRDSQRRQRVHVVDGAVVEVGVDLLGRPVRAFRLRVFDRGFELLALAGILRIEGPRFAELERVEDEVAVETGVHLRGAEREVHREVLDDLREDARSVVRPDRGPDRSVLAGERHVERPIRRLGGDDRLQVTELGVVIGVLEVHPRHLAEEAGDHRFGGVLETRDEFRDQLLRFGVTFGRGGLVGESGCGHRSQVLESRSRVHLAQSSGKTGEATLWLPSISRDRGSLPTTFSEIFGFVRFCGSDTR